MELKIQHLVLLLLLVALICDVSGMRPRFRRRRPGRRPRPRQRPRQRPPTAFPDIDVPALLAAVNAHQNQESPVVTSSPVSDSADFPAPSSSQENQESQGTFSTGEEELGPSSDGFRPLIPDNFANFFESGDDFAPARPTFPDPSTIFNDAAISSRRDRDKSPAGVSGYHGDSTGRHALPVSYDSPYSRSQQEYADIYNDVSFADI